MASSDTWTGQVFLSTTRALYLGPASDTQAHAHHAIQACFAVDKPFELRKSAAGPWNSYEAAIVGSNVRHQLNGCGGRLVLMYFEPEHVGGRRIGDSGSVTGIDLLGSAILKKVRAAVGRAETQGPQDFAARELFAAVSQNLNLASVAKQPLDQRIESIVRRLRTDPNRYGSISALAAHVGLSSSRFRHLFTSEMGVSCQQFLVWLRLYNAVRALASGISLTEAAHQVGFTDAAYLTRTFRRMFGIVPSAISRSVHLIAEDEDRRCQLERPAGRLPV